MVARSSLRATAKRSAVASFTNILLQTQRMKIEAVETTFEAAARAGAPCSSRPPGVEAQRAVDTSADRAGAAKPSKVKVEAAPGETVEVAEPPKKRKASAAEDAPAAVD